MSPVLTSEDLDHFLTRGYVVLRGAIPRETADEWAAECYDRLAIDPNDRSTWHTSRMHMGGTKSVKVREFCPVVWQATVELLGGEDRVQEAYWSDHFIVNLSEGADQPWRPASPECPGWHKDGDFFRHFLDSPEQGLLVFVAWTDVVHHGGPTYIAPDSIPVMAKYLADQPEGVLPNGFGFQDRIAECHDFEEATGGAGDVWLLHPFMLHAVSQNILRVPRIITNPPVSLREPMQFNRPDPKDFSPVEQVVLNALGVDRLDFQPTMPRERIVP
ncbi:MAG: hypothetical protein ACOYON_10185, partial [Fimbriimonas sp.]